MFLIVIGCFIGSLGEKNKLISSMIRSLMDRCEIILSVR